MSGRKATPAQTGLRLPKALHKRVQESAKCQKLSLNSELCRRIERSFDYDSIHEAVTAALAKAGASQS